MAETGIVFTNSITGKREAFAPIEKGKVTFYSCGPTVYDLIHIGNLRAALVADLIYRFLKSRGFEVNYVRNYTDIDDKIIDRAAKDGVSADVIAKKFTTEVEKDYAAAGLLEPTHKTKATEHVPQMIAMIETLVQKGSAYAIPGGDVFFSIGGFAKYGYLSGKSKDDLLTGVRIEVDPTKRDPLDFALWKAAKPGEPAWPSPWGNGRPGWHIECSAMARKWLGDQIDLHHGGQDLVFPHHENEIAQSEACTGKHPFVKTWLHHAFITVSKQKMAKSVGNVFTARDFLTKFGGEFARYAFLSVHYRQPLDFTDELMEQSLTGLERIYEAKRRALELSKRKQGLADPRAETAWGEFAASAQKARTEIAKEWNTDLNSAGVLGSVFSLIREFNRTLTSPRAEMTPAAGIGAQLLVDTIESDLGEVLGVGRMMPETVLTKLQEIRQALRGAAPTLAADAIEKKIQERLDARKAKDFKRADAIRDELAAGGVEIKDSPQGTTWRYS